VLARHWTPLFAVGICRWFNLLANP